MKNLVANKNRKGFTLVELIVVIVIIAIIAAIAIPRIMTFQDSAKKARIQAEHKQLITAIQMFKASKADPATAVPANLDALKDYMSMNGKTDINEVLAKNGDEVAHKIDTAAGTLTSTFVPSSGASETWVYNMK